MTRRERIVIWVGIGLALLAGIYPPWTRAVRSYDWLFARAYGASRVDFTRLLIEWIMIGLLTGGLYAVPLKYRQHGKQYSGKMPTRAFRQMVGLAPDKLAPGEEVGEVTFDCRDPKISKASKARQPTPEMLGRTPIHTSDDPGYPFLVELKDGGSACFSTIEGARHFRLSHPDMVRWEPAP